MVLFKNECSFSSVDNHMWWEHSNTLQKIELYALSGNGDAKPRVLALMPLVLALNASAHYKPSGKTFQVVASRLVGNVNVGSPFHGKVII